jgi:hypothetical protein
MGLLCRVGPIGRLRAWDACAWVVLAGLVVIVALIFPHYGISNDEEVQHAYGGMLLSFYASRFADQSAFHFKDLYYYGGLFDMVAILLERVSPLDIWDTRHLLSALIGILGIAAVWRLGRRLAGPAVGFVALALLALTGAWFGAMFNHTKDIPFAVALAWSLLFVCRILAELPRPSWPAVIGLGMTVGFALGLRVGAVIVVLPLATGFVLWAAQQKGLAWRDRGVALAQAGLRLVPAAVLAYAMMAASWPWAVLDPLNPMRALAHFSTLNLPIQTIFEGQIMLIAEVPASYLPIYLIIKLPLVMLVGLLLAVGYGLTRRFLPQQLTASSPGQRLGLVATAVAAAFPIAWFVIDHLPAYDGIRHFLFVVPPLAVLAAFGLVRAVEGGLLMARPVAFAGGAAVVVALLWQGSVLVRLHPYEYVDYNALVGGLAGAQRRYVMDYWANTVPEATRGLIKRLKMERPGATFLGPYKVWLCNGEDAFEAVAPKTLSWTSEAEEADFYIAPTHLNCDAPAGWAPHLLKGRTIYTVERLGVPLAVVRDRRSVVATLKVSPRG